MSSHFCVTVRFLDKAFHGRADGGHPEWPPSPLRLFQALVVAAARCAEGEVSSEARLALEWLERQRAPVVIAPAAVPTTGYSVSVPHNAIDIVAAAWSRGNESNTGDANPATHRTMKTFRPSRWVDDSPVHFVWQIVDAAVGPRNMARVLVDLARNIVAVGWGIDAVIGEAAELNDTQVEELRGERWLPSGESSVGGLRVPVEGTLSGLVMRHAAFVNRLSSGALSPPPPLSAYVSLDYRRATDPRPLPVAAFSLLNPETGRFRAFDTSARALMVAGMVRHACREAAERAGWSAGRVAGFVLGHGETRGDVPHTTVGADRFAYVPVPSVEQRSEGHIRVGPVRRVLVTTFSADCGAEIAWVRRALAGQPLSPQRIASPAILGPLPADDAVLQRYLRRAAEWTSVTPVVLPGYDDPAHYRRRFERGADAREQRDLLRRLHLRTDRLLRKALVQAGFSAQLAEHAHLEWRPSGFLPGNDLAARYGAPDHLRRFTRLHVRVGWRDVHQRPVSVPGPVCFGAGRFYGLGLCAAV